MYHGKQPRMYTEGPKDPIIKTQVCCCEVLVYLFLKLKLLNLSSTETTEWQE